VTETLYRLVYVSRNEISGGEQAVADEVRKILDVARQLNAIHDLTGALIFNRQCFAQVLEGHADRVQETFERIQRDARHSHATILVFEPADGREFSDWSMAYVGASSKALDAFNELTAGHHFEPAGMDGRRILTLLKSHLADADAA
jgi:hypothetical protein